MGSKPLPPNDFARLFRDETGDDHQLDFVYFLEGIEAKQKAVISDVKTFRATVDRSKWDVAQR